MTKNFKLLVIGLIALGFLITFFVILKNNNSSDNLSKNEGYYKYLDKQEFSDLKVGDGVEVKVGDNIKMNITLKFPNKTNATDKTEFLFRNTGKDDFSIVNVSNDSQGNQLVNDLKIDEQWKNYIVGMKVGGTRLVAIPNAYSKQNGTIKQNTTVLYELELLEIVSDDKMPKATATSTTTTTVSTESSSSTSQ